MKNYAMPAAVATVGLGLLSIGFNFNGNQANATPAAFNAGPVEPTIVWYDTQIESVVIGTDTHICGFLTRAWSDGRVECRRLHGLATVSWPTQTMIWCDGSGACTTEWSVLADPSEGLNAAADINFDERVDAADLGLLVASWGDAPRNDYPPSECPLGLIP
jgi:hypothetical protein